MQEPVSGELEARVCLCESKQRTECVYVCFVGGGGGFAIVTLDDNEDMLYKKLRWRR